MKYNQATLHKVEDLLKRSGYVLRYEKGNFIGGYCIVEGRKIIIINKFFDTEGRLNSLVEIIPHIHLAEDAMDDQELKLYKDILHESDKKSMEVMS